MPVSLKDLVEQILAQGEPQKRFHLPSGICPDCKAAPRVVSESGKQGPYCRECSRIRMKKYREQRAIRT